MNNVGEQDSLSLLEDLAVKIPNAKKTAQFGSAFGRAVYAAKEASLKVERLSVLSDFVILIAEHLEPSNRILIRESLLNLKRVGETTANASEVADLEEVTGQFKNYVPTAVEIVDRHLLNAWQTHVKGEFAAIGSLGEVLTRIPETESLGYKMADIFAQASSISQGLQSYNKQEKKYNDLKAERDALLDQLKQLGADQEVVDFLLAVANGEANLTHVTHATEAWLTRNNALEFFHVGL